VRRCCDIAWLACAVDSEGCLCLKSNSTQSANSRSFCTEVQITNSDHKYVEKCRRILNDLEVSYTERNNPTTSWTNKPLTTIHVLDIRMVDRLLDFIIPEMTTKQTFAMALRVLIASRLRTQGNARKARWTDDEVALAHMIREQHMPLARRANEEALPSGRPKRDKPVKSAGRRVISCQAKGSATSTLEGVETTGTMSATSKSPQECPATLTDKRAEEIVQASEKSERRDKEPVEDIAIN
jgi:hypothetical protein